MGECLEDYTTACRLCLQTKHKTLLLTNSHIRIFNELTGSPLKNHDRLPMTICIMCNREIRRFYEFRMRLIENQQRFDEMLEKAECGQGSVVVDSMAELVPANEEHFSDDSESTLSQDEVKDVDFVERCGFTEVTDTETETEVYIVPVERKFTMSSSKTNGFYRTTLNDRRNQELIERIKLRRKGNGQQQDLNRSKQTANCVTSVKTFDGNGWTKRNVR